MKLHKRLTVAGKSYGLVNEDVRLNLFSPGRASFTIQASESLSGLVIFSYGYEQDKVKPYFLGYVENTTTIDKYQQRLFCRELTAVLFNPLSVVLRNVTLGDVLDDVKRQTQITFELPDTAKPYTERRVGCFYSVSNGYGLLDVLPKVFGFSKPLWVQLTSGAVFIGSWEDSIFPNKELAISREWESDVTFNSVTLPVIPGLRPGVVYNNQIITSTAFSGLNSKVTFSENPWNDA